MKALSEDLSKYNLPMIVISDHLPSLVDIPQFFNMLMVTKSSEETLTRVQMCNLPTVPLEQFQKITSELYQTPMAALCIDYGQSSVKVSYHSQKVLRSLEKPVEDDFVLTEIRNMKLSLEKFEKAYIAKKQYGPK
jgi:hypothetical protein